MNGSPLSRRSFLALTALLGVGAGNALPFRDGERNLFFSAASDAAGKHWLNAFSLSGSGLDLRFRYQLPGRGHDVAVHTGAGLFVAVARRPGTFLLLGDLAAGDVQSLTVPPGRHLYGHGVFSADGRYFFTTESDFRNTEGDSGLVAVWEVLKTASGRTLKRLEEFSTGGVGPHELLLMPDGQTLAVANGGIRTHPDSERDKLNIETMAPSLVFIDCESGALNGHYRLPEGFHQASIRHIDVNEDGRIAMAMQYEGLPFHDVPLVATQQGAEAIRLLHPPEEVRIQMQQYVGSIRYDSSGRFIAASCPRGNMITFWDSVDGTYVEQVRSRDGCGICAVDGGFVITAGSTGKIRHYNLSDGTITDFGVRAEHFPDRVFWDNHLTSA